MCKKIDDQFDVISIVELADLLGISRRYAYTFIRENNIKFRKVGRKFYILRKSLNDFMTMEE